ncbi:carbohydrate sulfotransferase 11-like [Rhinatrema bivittatum]|uniref:carbohydrate sulfotransferase 11-like n=1 Tax=Rhinatrema bivittatum TaxID=194408 RepID=UPI001129A4B3|nr:carbohydrate sulfotransferase 11-like [Rhinatrema bivittatum]XP_029448894.1 carbohydrate sulfotransferase 11-like [Rhinatrema bivittatum]
MGGAPAWCSRQGGRKKMRFLSRVLLVACLGAISLLCWRWRASLRSPGRRAGDPVARNVTFTADTFLHVQQLRKRALRTFCRANAEVDGPLCQGSTQQAVTHLVVNPRFEFVHCRVPSVGAEAWERLLQALAERRQPTAETPVISTRLPPPALPTEYLRDYNLTSIELVLRSYTKVLFVRDPFQRLISAYRRQFAGKVTFSDFIHRVLGSRGREAEVLWKPLVSLCCACLVRYDYILTYGFLGQEVHHLMHRMGMPGDVVAELAGPRFQRSGGRVAEQLASELSERQKQQLREAYGWDFAAFGFPGSEL